MHKPLTVLQKIRKHFRTCNEQVTSAELAEKIEANASSVANTLHRYKREFYFEEVEGKRFVRQKTEDNWSHRIPVTTYARYGSKV